MSDDMINWDKDADGIVVLTMDDPHGGANTWSEAFRAAFSETVTRLENQRDDITGVVLASGKKTFFAGANLDELAAVSADQAQELFELGRLEYGVVRPADAAL